MHGTRGLVRPERDVVQAQEGPGQEGRGPETEFLVALFRDDVLVPSRWSHGEEFLGPYPVRQGLKQHGRELLGFVDAVELWKKEAQH